MIVNDPFKQTVFLAPSETPFLVDYGNEVQLDLVRLVNMRQELTPVIYDELLTDLPRVRYRVPCNFIPVQNLD